jgi:transglutaminase-like putative cysteine protease
MRVAIVSLLALLPGGLAGGQPPGQPEGKLVLDLWDVAYLQGARAGHVRTTVHEHDAGGQKVYRGAVEMNLSVKRFNDTVQLRALTGTDETADGKVVGVFMRQQLGQNKVLSITGQVVGGQLKLTLDDKHPMQPAPWDERVLGLYRQQTLFQAKKAKPGDRFEYQSFEPTVNLVVTTRVEVKGREDVELFGGKTRKKLLRVEATPEKIEKVQLPTLVVWLDDDLTVARSQVEVPGLGQLVLYRTTRDNALTPAELAKLTDIGISQLVRLSKRVPDPYATTAAVYRVTYKGDDDPATVFSADDRQQVKNLKGKVFELHVRAPEPGADGGAKAGDEFTQSSYFINCDDARVKELARRAAGSEIDPWRKALKLEKWVHQNMTVRSHEALATADHVARTLEGDCTEYAMLLAAMCRAERLPSRTAVGLIYADVKGAPHMAFHMWTEVFVGGRWHALDATLGRGRVGATHLKITDASWHNRRDLAPLLPVIRALGKVAIDVVSVK